MTEIYLDDERHGRLVDNLLNVQPCPFAGRVTADQITLALGEAGDIWPLSSRDDDDG
jgi:hypothetical protein